MPPGWLYVSFQFHPKHKYRLGREWTEHIPEGKDLGVLAY